MPSKHRPISFRPGELRAKLEARGGTTPARQDDIARRDLTRYYEMISTSLELVPSGDARRLYALWRADPAYPLQRHGPTVYPLIDALERAHLLVEEQGYDIDLALREVGLVR